MKGERLANAQYSSTQVGTLVTGILTETGFEPEITGDTTAGELEEVCNAGYTAFGFFGNFEVSPPFSPSSRFVVCQSHRIFPLWTRTPL
jgi:hypothetical protein